MNSKALLEVLHYTVNLSMQDHLYPIVNDISLAIKPGQTLALVGESGCGKSITALSILRIASLPVMEATGDVLFEGHPLASFSESQMRRIRGKDIAMIFQDPSNALNPVFTIGNQLMEAIQLHSDLDDEAAWQKSIEALTGVGIAAASDRMHDYPHQLSGGMKQRVMIAMAIISEPKLLIADEPTTALDVTIQAQVLDLLQTLQQRTQMAILLITHDMGVVAEIADEVAVMYSGNIVEKGNVQQIFKNPSHPYTMGLFQALHRKDSKKGHLHTIQGSVPSLQQRPSGCPFHPRCPFAFEKCFTGKVPDFVIHKEPHHQASCWLRETR